MFTGRRIWAAFFAAFIIALPLLWVPLVLGVLGLFAWACMFIPALAGIIFVQLPTKILTTRQGWTWGSTYLAVLASNLLFSIFVAKMTGLGIIPWGWAALIAASLIAASIWNALDDRAIIGPETKNT